MSDGRTIWRCKDTGWWGREWIVTLGEEFGPAGPAVIDWLEDQAKLQNDGGRVKAGPRAVARGCFVDVVTVGHVLSRSVTLGLLTDYTEDKGRFECVITWFAADQGRGMAAQRKGRQRHQDPVGKGDPPSLSRSVPVGHASSRPVTNTGQDNTDTFSAKAEKNTTAELRSATLEAFAYWQDRCNHPTAKLTGDRRSKIEARLRDGYTVQDIRKAIDGAARAPFVNDAGKRFDDIELICRSGSKLESFVERADAPVVPIGRTPAPSEKQQRQERRLAAFQRLTGGAAS